MAQPGRPKGRPNKPKVQPQTNSLPHSEYNPHIHGNSQYVPPQHAQPLQRNQPRLREEIIQVQDEADLILFRSDAVKRYTSNHELIENITAKCIHTNKIVPPALYPKPKETTFIKDVSATEVYFGSIVLMKQKLEVYKNQIDALPAKYTLPAEYTYQSQQTDKLADLITGPTDKLHQELKTLLQDYKSKYNKNYVCSKQKKYSAKILKNVKQAPADYNPRYLNKFDQRKDYEMNGLFKDSHDNHDDVDMGDLINFDADDQNGFDDGFLNI